MKVSATFNEQGLKLVLTAETDSEQRMVGAVLGLPQEDRQSEILAELLQAKIGYEGHFSNRKVSWLQLTLLKHQGEGN